MKRPIIALTAMALTCGLAHGQEASAPNAEKLKCYDPFIGVWRYEGPALEAMPGVVDKGAECVVQFSWRRILNKNAIESRAFVEVEGKGNIYSERTLIAWNAAANKIVYAGAASNGSIFLGSTTANEEAKTLSDSSTGVASDGRETLYRGVATITDKDTMTWRALDALVLSLKVPARYTHSSGPNAPDDPNSAVRDTFNVDL